MKQLILLPKPEFIKHHGVFWKNVLSALFKTGVIYTSFIPQDDWIPSWKIENQNFKGRLKPLRHPRAKALPSSRWEDCS